MKEPVAEQIATRRPVAIMSPVENAYRRDLVNVPVINGAGILVCHVYFTVVFSDAVTGKTMLHNNRGIRREQMETAS